jgi:hypothetical protein
MKEIPTSPAVPRSFELGSRRIKCLGDAIGWKEFEESLEENKNFEYFIIRVEADNPVLGWTPQEKLDKAKESGTTQV